MRCTVPFLECLCNEFCGDSVEHVAMKRLTAALCQFYDIIYDGSYFLADASLERLDDALNDVGRYMMLLREFSRRRQDFLFQIVPISTPFLSALSDKCRTSYLFKIER